MGPRGHAPGVEDPYSSIVVVFFKDHNQNIEAKNMYFSDSFYYYNFFAVSDSFCGKGTPYSMLMWISKPGDGI